MDSNTKKILWIFLFCLIVFIAVMYLVFPPDNGNSSIGDESNIPESASSNSQKGDELFEKGEYEQAILFYIETGNCKSKVVNALNTLIKNIRRGYNQDWTTITKSKLALEKVLKVTKINDDTGLGGHSKPMTIESLIKRAQSLKTGWEMVVNEETIKVSKNGIEQIEVKLLEK